MLNREKETFPRPLEMNPRGKLSLSSFILNDVRKVNVTISLHSGKKVDTYVGEHDVDVSPSSSFSFPSSQECDSHDVSTYPCNPPPSKDLEDHKENDFLDTIDSTSSKATLTFSPKALKPSPPFLTERKKIQSHVEKIREIFSQIKITIALLDVIQQMLCMLVFLKNYALAMGSLMFPREPFLASNVSLIISNQVPIRYKDLRCLIISIVIGNYNILRALLGLGASVNLSSFMVYERLGLGSLNLLKCSFNWLTILLGLL